MHNVLFFVCLGWSSYCVCAQNIMNPGPPYLSTKGEVWPAPQFQKKYSDHFVFKPEQFIFIDHSNCDLISKAIERYSSVLNGLHSLVLEPARAGNNKRRKILVFKKNKALTPTSYKHYSNHTHETNTKKYNFRGEINSGIHRQIYASGNNLRSTKAIVDNGEDGVKVLASLEIILQNNESSSQADTDPYPDIHMLEKYNLEIDQKSVLRSASKWGLLRGLETFSQSFYLTDDRSEVHINKSTISDKPAYAHRGLMLDTARHFISIENIQKILQAMEYNKLNVFHWHLTDDESFPFRSASYKDFSDKGAYSSKAQYYQEDIRTIVEFARDRGIRVIPELNVPSHTRSWGIADPSLLTMCYVDDNQIGLGPLNPTLDKTYQVLRVLIEEIKSLFPDKSLNLGMNDIDFYCWLHNPDIAAYMGCKNLTDEYELLDVFLSKVQEVVSNDTHIIVAETAANKQVHLRTGTYVQVYDESTLNDTLCQGHVYIYSACWKMDTISVSTASWKEFYSCGISEQLDNETVLGGEAIMQTHFIDDNNVISRIWPLASATAEYLWSNPKADMCTEPPSQRMEEHACRMLRRGVRVQPPNGPGYCPM